MPKILFLILIGFFIAFISFEEPKKLVLEPERHLQQELYSQGLKLRENCTLTSCDSISTELFLKEIDQSLKVLEIGPYFVPSLKGSNVKYFDVLDKVGLIKKAKEENLEESRMSGIPEIDYVNSTGDMSAIEERFDVVFSSHNIEHQVDLIKHLNQVYDLLKENGKFYLRIPDKRYCFDHFIPESTDSDVLDSHFSGAKYHPLRIVSAMRCETTHNDPVRHWRGDHGEMISNKDELCYQKALDFYFKNQDRYLDSHRWRFTPQQFEYIINSLYNQKFIKFKVLKVYLTEFNSAEFKAILYKAS